MNLQGRDLKKARKELQMTQDSIAEISDYSTREISRLEGSNDLNHHLKFVNYLINLGIICVDRREL